MLKTTRFSNVPISRRNKDNSEVIGFGVRNCDCKPPHIWI